MCVYYYRTYYKAVCWGGTLEEPGTVAQGGSLFSLEVLVSMEFGTVLVEEHMEGNQRFYRALKPGAL